MYTLLIHIFNRDDSKFARERKKKKKIWDTKEIRSSCLDDGGRDCKHLALMNLCSVVNAWSSVPSWKRTVHTFSVRIYILCYTRAHFCRALCPNDFSRGNLERDSRILDISSHTRSKRDACRLYTWWHYTHGWRISVSFNDPTERIFIISL